jgi:hypothetical protein
LFERVSTFAVW